MTGSAHNTGFASLIAGRYPILDTNTVESVHLIQPPRRLPSPELAMATSSELAIAVIHGRVIIFT
jgi:hypothetical protein